MGKQRYFLTSCVVTFSSNKGIDTGYVNGVFGVDEFPNQEEIKNSMAAKLKEENPRVEEITQVTVLGLSEFTKEEVDQFLGEDTELNEEK